MTGNSDTADYKDTILKKAPPITNCTSTTVTTPKTGAGVDVPGVGFHRHRRCAREGLRRRRPRRRDGDPAAWSRSSSARSTLPGCAPPGGRRWGRRPHRRGIPATVLPRPPTSLRWALLLASGCTGDPVNGIPRANDSSATECFTVNPVTPRPGPRPQAQDVPLGGAVSDTATLTGTATQPANPIINLTGTGGAAAGGSITFKLYGPNKTATTLAYTSAAVTVSGHGTYNSPAPQFVPTAARNLPLGRPVVQRQLAQHKRRGTHNADCTDTNEDVTVNTVPSSMTTGAEVGAERRGHDLGCCR